MLMHVSDRFPSHWVLVGELAAMAMLAFLAWRWPAFVAWSDRFWRLMERLPHGRRAPWLYALLGAVGAASVSLALGVPVPRVTDEQANLLAADTFARGRLASPTPPFVEHFEQQHVLSRPVRMSKYPPGPALVMALGQATLGHPVVGLWWQAGALAAAIYWLVAGLLPHPWPATAALLAIARLGIGSYWHQSYWGGGLAAIGGCLALGAVLRLVETPTRRAGLWLGVGLVILANSRPYEGLLFGAPLVAIALWRASPRPGAGAWSEQKAFRAALWPAMMVGGAALVWMLYYNHRLTGDALRLPHLLYTESALADHGHFLWTDPGSRDGWLRRVVPQLLTRGAFFVELALGLSVAPIALMSWLGGVPFERMPKGTRSHRGARLRALAVWSATATILVGQSLTVPWFPHYGAPAIAGVVVLAAVGLCRLQSWRPRGRALGSALAACAWLVSVIAALVQVPAYRADDDDWSLRRAAVDDQLESASGRHLVIVRYLDGSRRGGDWVFNLADLDQAKVLWAHELSRERADRLRAAFPGRRAWLLEIEHSRADRGLVPWPAPAASQPARGARTLLGRPDSSRRFEAKVR